MRYRSLLWTRRREMLRMLRPTAPWCSDKADEPLKVAPHRVELAIRTRERILGELAS